MDIPVFDLKSLKKYFTGFFVVSVIIAVLSYVAVIFVVSGEAGPKLRQINTWYLTIPLFVWTYVQSLNSKTALNEILETTDYEQRFKKYEAHYKKRLGWNLVSIALTGVFLIITQKNFVLYFMILQLVLTSAFYPRKAIIAKELKDDTIVFT
ncbi:hypothetical protein ACFS6H_14495 [Terrimonas rubra]|uniref:Uncharacterized protein n=1 Tax=Terrimonas rubra TaxID=1035890 RepID=A0ABW6A949_9BACT